MPLTTIIHTTHNQEFPGESGRLYELVTRHFLATLSHDARFLQTKVLLSSTSGESFTVSGKIMIDPGYPAVLLQSKVGNGGGGRGTILLFTHYFSFY
jgi:DNA topoisomerase-3